MQAVSKTVLANQLDEPFAFHEIPTPKVDQRKEILEGLEAEQKWVSPKYFYDERGSQLFDQITREPEYYPTRTELKIFKDYGKEIAQYIGKDTLLVEPGSGTSDKIQHLFAHETPAVYAPAEISKECLIDAACTISRIFPEIDVQAICTDFTQLRTLPESLNHYQKTAFFPGSTIGNFTPEKAKELLSNFKSIIGPGGYLLIGVDLLKSIHTLNAAYNDRAGTTATFNLNALAHLSRILGHKIESNHFEHHAFFNPKESRIEMHLRCVSDYRLSLGDKEIEFKRGETIHTENSYKYTLESFRELANDAGYDHVKTWTDDQSQFSFHCLVAR